MQATGEPEAEQIFPAGHVWQAVEPGSENYNGIWNILSMAPIIKMIVTLE